MGTTTIEDVAAAEPDGTQLVPAVPVEGPGPFVELVDRAAAAGYDTLLVTVDVPSPGARLRDVRNGMTIPPTLTPRRCSTRPAAGVVVRLPDHGAARRSRRFPVGGPSRS